MTSGNGAKSGIGPRGMPVTSCCISQGMHPASSGRVAGPSLSWGTAVLFAFIGACAPPTVCLWPGRPAPVEPASFEAVYAGAGDPYVPGPLTVRTVSVAPCERGAPVAMRIHAPEQPDVYPLVVFQHGFLQANSSYTEILTHLASHGFVVVVPQMYPPFSLPLGLPSAEQEASNVVALLDWLPGQVDALTGVTVDATRTGLAGHSRGGRVVWTVLGRDAGRARAVAGVDPVDGGFLGRPRAIDGLLPFALPTLVLGAGLGSVGAPGAGMSCAPEGANHQVFYDASPGPAWHIVATDHGHVDMLDEDCPVCGLTRFACPGGPDRAGMRRLTAGLLTAFFRGTLQDDPNALAWLTDAAAAPVAVTTASR